MLLTNFYPELQATLETIHQQKPSLERRAVIELIGEACAKADDKAGLHLNFICTHNSRRSQLSQIWSACLADLHGWSHWEHHSAGTEATAFHPNAIQALTDDGFHIIEIEKGSNPKYRVQWREDHPGIICFSKTIGEALPPETPFMALMTCGDADENCPFIPEAIARLPFRFKDPKVSDGTPEQAQTYRERSRQIAVELNYLYQNLKK
jgi:arsenate reductase